MRRRHMFVSFAEYVRLFAEYVKLHGAVETELHFLLQCAAYEDQRHQLFCEIAFVDPSFLYLSKE